MDPRLRDLRLPDRPATLHKWSAGRVVVVAGSVRYPGAPILVARAALRAGAGLVTLAAPAPLVAALAGRLPEATLLPLPVSVDGEIDAARAAATLAGERSGSLVVGPGLSPIRATAELVHELIDTTGTPIVLDAGALSAIAAAGSADALLAAAARTVIVTPHVGEFLALSGAPSADTEHVGDFSKRSNAIVVCKGSTTLIASPDGRVAERGVPNPLLATSGTGDVLVGILGALLAAGMDPYEAALSAVDWHAAAGARLAERLGDAGLLALELADELPVVRRERRR